MCFFRKNIYVSVLQWCLLFHLIFHSFHSKLDVRWEDRYWGYKFFHMQKSDIIFTEVKKVSSFKSKIALSLWNIKAVVEKRWKLVNTKIRRNGSCMLD